MTLFGNDVSSNNGSSNVDLDNNDFSFVKISEGNFYYNPYAYQQSKQVQDNGKLLGYYHWLTPNIDVIEQAKYFLAGVGNDAYIDDIVLALDYEENGVNGNEPKVFLDYIYQQTGKRPLIYMNADYASGHSGKFDWSDIADDYGLWLAGGKNYGQNLGYSQFDQAVFNSVNWWEDITVWQYTSSPYDRNILFGDKNSWYALGSKKKEVEIPVENKTGVSHANYQYTPINDAKFVVGDKVQILPHAYQEANGYDLQPHQLWQGTVTKVTPVQCSNSEYEYYITYKNGQHNDHVLEQDLQLWSATNN